MEKVTKIKGGRYAREARKAGVRAMAEGKARAKAAKAATAKRDKKTLALIERTWLNLRSLVQMGEFSGGGALSHDYTLGQAQKALAAVKGEIELRQLKG